MLFPCVRSSARGHSSAQQCADKLAADLLLPFDTPQTQQVNDAVHRVDALRSSMPSLIKAAVTKQLEEMRPVADAVAAGVNDLQQLPDAHADGGMMATTTGQPAAEELQAMLEETFRRLPALRCAIAAGQTRQQGGVPAPQPRLSRPLAMPAAPYHPSQPSSSRPYTRRPRLSPFTRMALAWPPRARMDHTVQRLSRILGALQSEEARPSPKTVERVLMNRLASDELDDGREDDLGVEDAGKALTRRRLAQDLHAPN